MPEKDQTDRSEPKSSREGSIAQLRSVMDRAMQEFDEALRRSDEALAKADAALNGTKPA